MYSLLIFTIAQHIVTMAMASGALFDRADLKQAGRQQPVAGCWQLSEPQQGCLVQPLIHSGQR